MKLIRTGTNDTARQRAAVVITLSAILSPREERRSTRAAEGQATPHGAVEGGQ